MMIAKKRLVKCHENIVKHSKKMHLTTMNTAELYLSERRLHFFLVSATKIKMNNEWLPL